MRVLYLYSGKRKGLKYGQGSIGIDYPDTQFYGLNHLKEFGIEADYKEFDDFYPAWLGNFLSFRWRHFLMFFAARKYDLVFGSSLIYLMPLKILFRPRVKFVLLNIYLNRLLAANKKRFLRFWLIRFLIRRLDGIVCLANLQKDYLAENYGFPKEKIFFVPLGVDAGFHAFTPDNGREDFILSVGSDDGRDYRAVLKVAGNMPEARFIIVCGQKNMAGIAPAEIPANVKILYYISSQELRDLYRRARMFLLTTYPDGHSQGADCSGQTVLLDAMASGLPLVANYKAYLSDYIRGGQEVLVAPSNSPKELKSRIDLLLADRELRSRLARAARQKVEESFTTRLMAQKLTFCFRGIGKK